jgi:asparagine synthase (glutamine-hydrolysing)
MPGMAPGGPEERPDMCGICGNVTFDRPTSLDVARLRVETMLQSLSHRGPDGAHQLNTDPAVLGATRLAIRGLNERLSQPMVDAESGVMAVCNGEIDNHRELSQWLADRGRPVRQETDVAVIPGLYLELGEAFASRLVGAFAIAVWDSRQQRLTLVRDRAGERPLFYAREGNEIVFATEIAALATGCRLPLSLDPEALQKYLQLGIFPSPATPFKEIRKVAPGEWIQFTATGVRRNFYWSWRTEKPEAKPPSLDTFDRTFRAAVSRQSAVDVDFGVFLSGGIDSSLVSAVVRSLYPKRSLKAYTLRFEEESFDEGTFAEAMAKQLKMDLVTVWAKPGDVPAGLKSLIRLVGEPLADPAWLPAALLARRAAQDIKLAFVGEGADELFGGYPTYIGAGLADRFVRLPLRLQSLIRSAVKALPLSEKKVTVSFLLKRFVQGTDLNGLARHRLWVSNIAPAVLRRLGLTPAEFENPNPDAAPLLDQLQQWDLETSLAEGLLTKADRASMSSSLELRAPFLDQAVMEFARSLPVAERVRGFNTKAFLKRYARRYLPDRIVSRRKRGLSVPMARWLRGPLKDWALATLETGRLKRVGIQTSAAMDLFSEHCRHEADHARALWTLLVLGEWLGWLESLEPMETEKLTSSF